MKNGKFRIVLGLILVVFQIVSLVCMNTTNTHIWDSNDNANHPVIVKPTKPTLVMFFYGFTVGHTKLTLAFQELPEALKDHAEEGYYYHSLTSSEYTSLRIREGLAAGNEIDQAMRYVYDFTVALGCFLYGIVGIFLIVFGWRAKQQWDANPLDSYYTDAPNTLIQRIGLIVCGCCLAFWLIFALPYLSQHPYWFLELVCPLCYIAMGLFFLRFYGKKCSMLPCATLLLYAAPNMIKGLAALSNLWLGTPEDPLNTYFNIRSLCYLLGGGAVLAAGILLYVQNSKKQAKFLVLAGVCIRLLGEVIYDVGSLKAYSNIYHSVPIANWIYLAAFGVMLILYMWLGNTYTPKPMMEQPKKAPMIYPTGCPSCGATVSPGRIRCLRCGTLVAVAKTPTVAAAPIAEKAEPFVQAQTAAQVQPPETQFCRMCGKRLRMGDCFCGYCGAQVLREAPEAERTNERL